MYIGHTKHIDYLHAAHGPWIENPWSAPFIAPLVNLINTLN
jgi:hypothetical protein